MYLSEYKLTPEGISHTTECHVSKCPQRDKFHSQLMYIVEHLDGITIDCRTIVECKKSPGFKCVNHFDNKP